MIGSIIRGFPRTSFDISRPGAVVSVRGRDTAGAATVTSGVLGVVVPATPRDLVRLPEGLRARETLRILVPTADADLRTGDDAGTMPDEVILRGQRWEVGAVSSWNDAGGFLDVLVVRRPHGGPA